MKNVIPNHDANNNESCQHTIVINGKIYTHPYIAWESFEIMTVSETRIDSCYWKTSSTGIVEDEIRERENIFILWVIIS